MANKTAFVTGAGGFIGRHLVADLTSKGYAVAALMMDKEPVPEEWTDEVRIVRGDIRNLDELADTIGAFDVLFHLAAVVSDWGAKQEHVEVTVNGTEKAISLALSNNARFIVTTSVAAYADSLGQGLLTEETLLGKPESHYEFCKQEQERVTQEAVDKFGLRATIIRPANVYGIGSRPWVEMPLALMEQKKPVLIGSGDWDAGLVNVKNLIQLMMQALNSQYCNGEVFIAADGYGITWKEYWTRLSGAANAPKPRRIPKYIGLVSAPFFETLGRLFSQTERPLITKLAYKLTGQESIYSTEKSRSLLGYEPSISFDQAMTELAEYYATKNNTDSN